ncbi:jg11849 [Pararge aegeria aegeria]|uniref:Jg11849 protein n=1 Tax=Pararge aegeria aegeria TaxID=348720 RepID=A0A8S4SG30_9NEOP|nr:jg11849 [Pararge aegeria aegeria]
MWRRGPLLSEQSRQRSVNAVKLRSSGSVIAKHLMRRSRRQELSMYTAVVVGWRETSTHVAGTRGGVAPPLRSGGTGPCAPDAPLAPPCAPTPPGHPPPAHSRGWLGRAGKCVPVSPSAIADCIDYDVLIYIDVTMKRKENAP